MGRQITWSLTFFRIKKFRQRVDFSMSNCHSVKSRSDTIHNDDKDGKWWGTFFFFFLMKHWADNHELFLRKKIDWEFGLVYWDAAAFGVQNLEWWIQWFFCGEKKSQLKRLKHFKLYKRERAKVRSLKT